MTNNLRQYSLFTTLDLQNQRINLLSLRFSWLSLIRSSKNRLRCDIHPLTGKGIKFGKVNKRASFEGWSSDRKLLKLRAETDGQKEVLKSGNTCLFCLISCFSRFTLEMNVMSWEVVFYSCYFVGCWEMKTNTY